MSCDTGLYFAQFPRNFDRLQAVLLTVQNGRECANETSAGPAQFYREIIFTEPELLIAPQPNEDGNKIVVIAESHVLTSSRLCSTLEKFSLKIMTSVPLKRNLFLHCFEFVLKHRLAPFWNKVGPYYIKGRDFLQEVGKMTAIRADISLTDKITVALNAQMLKLPPYQFEDCGIAPNIMEKFNCSKSFTIHGHSLENNKCLVLPSLKTGYISCIAHWNAEDFDFKKYWKVMYGFRVPDSQPQDAVYSVCFPAACDKIFLYPGYCIRRKEPLVYLRCDQKAIYSSFIDDLSSRLPSLCGLPLKFTSSSLYPTKTFSTAVMSKQTNLTRTIKPSSASEMFVFTGNQHKSSDKTNGNSTVSSPPKSRTIHPTKEHFSDGTIGSVKKPYVPSFTKQRISGNMKKTLSKKSSETDVKRDKPIVPCFMRKSTQCTSNPKKATAVKNPGRIIETHMELPENESVFSDLANTSEHQNSNNEQLTVRHTATGHAAPLATNQSRNISFPADNQTREWNNQHETSQATKKCLNLQLKRNEKKEKTEPNIDVRKLAIENKLSTVNAAAITKWLKAEGIHCKSKDKKGDLLLKVYQHLGL